MKEKGEKERNPTLIIALIGKEIYKPLDIEGPKQDVSSIGISVFKVNK